MMKEAAEIAHRNNKKFMLVNGLFHNYHLDALEDYIHFTSNSSGSNYFR